MTGNRPRDALHRLTTDGIDVPPLPPLLTYGITPPKRSWEPQRVAEVAARQTARIRDLPVDAVVVYDLQDESTRTDAPRPFPYEPCQDPVSYAYEQLAGIEVPRVVYRCVAPLEAHDLRDSLQRLATAEDAATVLVGAASREQQTQLSLPAAYRLHAEVAPGLPLGGVLIAERHRDGREEHERVLRKMERGCSFFVSQAVYATEDTRNVLSDLAYRCADLGIAPPRVLVTLTPCGSERTLTFLRWLGVTVPPWLENELLRSADTLATSVDVGAAVFADLHAFAADLGIELGCNVESVSLRRDEIDASVALVHRVAAIMGRDARDA